MSDLLRMKLPLAIVTGIVSAAAAGGGAWAVAGERSAMHEAKISNHEERLTAAERALQEERLARTRAVEEERLERTRVGDALSNVVEMVKEIRSDVKDIKRGK